jgi:hypothetical protein
MYTHAALACCVVATATLERVTACLPKACACGRGWRKSGRCGRCCDSAVCELDRVCGDTEGEGEEGDAAERLHIESV